MQLKSMSLDKLVALKNQVEAALSAKVTQERRSLKSELGKLTRFGGGGADSKLAFRRGGARGKVAPKYRNPDNDNETWAGRGLKPRWVVAAIKSGKKLEEFLIEGAAKATRIVRKKIRKARK
jgi:DNA-binding protein H-NS